MNTEHDGRERFPWAGPALFTTVLVALVAFFWWLVSGGQAYWETAGFQRMIMVIVLVGIGLFFWWLLKGDKES